MKLRTTKFRTAESHLEATYQNEIFADVFKITFKFVVVKST